MYTRTQTSVNMVYLVMVDTVKKKGEVTCKLYFLLNERGVKLLMALLKLLFYKVCEMDFVLFSSNVFLHSFEKVAIHLSSL